MKEKNNIEFDGLMLMKESTRKLTVNLYNAFLSEKKKLFPSFFFYRIKYFLD